MYRGPSSRVVARRSLIALVAVASFTMSFTGPVADAATDAASVLTAGRAVTWIQTLQAADGGFGSFESFESRDAILAIAQNAQTGTAWDTAVAKAAVAAVKFGGAGASGLDWLETFALTVDTAGKAAKTIVLTAAPLGISPTVFDPQGNGSPVNLVAMLDAGCGANSANFGAAFSDTLYGVIAKKIVCGATPTNAIAAVRAAQQPNGGWNFAGDNTGTDVDIDVTSLAIQALVASGADSTDTNVKAALVFLATNQHANGAWEAFGSDDPNSTAVGAIGVAAAGFDPASSCWRDTVVPAMKGTAYTSPDAWLRSQEDPVDHHIVSPNDTYGVNTYATSQSVQGLLRRWLPLFAPALLTCVAAPVVPEVGGIVVLAPEVTPTFTG